MHHYNDNYKLDVEVYVTWVQYVIKTVMGVEGFHYFFFICICLPSFFTFTVLNQREEVLHIRRLDPSSLRNFVSRISPFF